MTPDTQVKACSTPFGIIGILTVPGPERSNSLIKCSTPFGIIGILTGIGGEAIHTRSGAQRLSASSEFSRASLAPSFAAIAGAQRLSASSEFSHKHTNRV